MNNNNSNVVFTVESYLLNATYMAYVIPIRLQRFEKLEAYPLAGRTPILSSTPRPTIKSQKTPWFVRDFRFHCLSDGRHYKTRWRGDQLLLAAVNAPRPQLRQRPITRRRR